MTESLGRAELELATDQSGFDRGLDQAKGKTTSFLGSVQAGFKKASGSIQQGFGVGIGIATFNLAHRAISGIADAVMGATTNAIAFERSMVNVNTIAKMTDAELAATGESVLALGAKFGQSSATMAKGLYDIASSGFAGADGLKVLEAAAQAATAGMSTTGEAASGITAVLNSYALSADQAGHVSDVMFKIVERGVITFPELSAQIGKTTALASPLGVSLEEVGAALAVLTKNGIDAENATTQVNAVLTSILQPSAQAAKLAKELGLEWNIQSLRANGLSGVLGQMIEKTNGSQEAMATLLGDARAIRGAFVLAAGGGKQLNEELGIMQTASGATAEAFAKQSETLGFRLAQLGAKLEVLGITVMTHVLPVIGLVVDNFDTLIPLFAAAATAILTILIPALGRMAIAAAGAMGPIGLLITGLAALGMAVSDAVNDTTPEIERLRKILAENTGGLDLLGERARFQARIDELQSQIDIAASVAKQKWAAYIAEANAMWVDTGIPEAVGDVMTGIAKKVAAGEWEIRDGALVAAKGFKPLRDKSGDTATQVHDDMDRIVTAVKSLEDRLADDADEAADAIFNPTIEKGELAAAKVELSSLRREIASGKLTTTEKREAGLRAVILEKEIFTREAKLTRHQTTTEQIAFLTSDRMKQGLASKDPAIRKEFEDLAADIVSGWSGLKGNAFPYGFNTGNAYVDGLINSLEERFGGFNKSLAKYKNRVRAESPPVRGAALYGIDRDGYNTGEAYVDNLVRALDTARSRIEAPLAAVRSLMGHAGAGLPDLGGVGLAPGALTVGGTVHVAHTIDAAGALALKGAGFDERAVAAAMVDATGLVSNLRQLSAMTPG